MLQVCVCRLPRGLASPGSVGEGVTGRAKEGAGDELLVRGVGGANAGAELGGWAGRGAEGSREG